MTTTIRPTDLHESLAYHEGQVACYLDGNSMRHVFRDGEWCQCGDWTRAEHARMSIRRVNGGGVPVSEILEWVARQPLPLRGTICRGITYEPPINVVRTLTGIARDDEAELHHLAWVNAGALTDRAQQCRAGLLLANYSEGFSASRREAAVYCDHPKLLFALIANRFFPAKPDTPPMVGKNVTIGPGSHVVNCVIGDNVTIGANCSIGAPGFGYVRDLEGRAIRFPQVGQVIIQDNAEIANNVCIDRGALGDTIIRRGAKIDNLVHIAHNCLVGEDALVVAGAVLCGGVSIGPRAFIGAGAMIREQLLIGADAVVGLGAVVVKNVRAGETVVGNPAARLAGLR